MAFVKKVAYTLWLDRATGARVPAGTPGAEQRTARTKKYRAFYTDPMTGKQKSVPGFTDKGQTFELARKLERGESPTSNGRPVRGVARKELAELLDLYAVKLRERNGQTNHPAYVA